VSTTKLRLTTLDICISQENVKQKNVTAVTRFASVSTISAIRSARGQTNFCSRIPERTSQEPFWNRPMPTKPNETTRSPHECHALSFSFSREVLFVITRAKRVKIRDKNKTKQIVWRVRDVGHWFPRFHSRVTFYLVKHTILLLEIASLLSKIERFWVSLCAPPLENHSKIRQLGCLRTLPEDPF